MAASATLLEGPIRGHLTRLALPMAIGIVFIIANNLIDTYFVGRLGGAELAAMSFTFPVVSLVMSIAMGLGIGATAAIARAIGQGRRERAGFLAADACLLAIAIVIALSGVGLLTQRQVFTLLGAGPAVLDLLVDYMTVWYAGAVFLVVPMVGTGAMRADGDAKTPMLLMGATALTNLALDPLLIFGLGPVPALGIRGAAVATVVARAVLLLLTITMLRRRDLLKWRLSKEIFASWRSLLSVGLPAAVANALAPVATAIITGLLAGYGATAVAAYGVASRVEGLILIPAMAIGSAMTPFVGQNWGGHQEDRVEEAMTMARRFVMLWGLLAWGLVALAGRQVGGAFSQDANTIELVQMYLWIVPLSYGASGVVSVITAVFNAVDRAVRSTILSATRSLLLAVPAALLGASWFGAPGVFAGVAAATVVTALIAAIWSRSLFVPAKALTEVKEGAHLQGAKTEVVDFVDLLLDHITHDMAITVAARPINTIGFFAQGYEVGHVHRNGKVDFHVPPPLRDALIKDGIAESHRHLEEGHCWVSHTLSSTAEVNEAAWLLRVLGALRAFGKGAIDRDAFDEAVVHKRPSAHLHPAVDAALQLASRGGLCAKA